MRPALTFLALGAALLTMPVAAQLALPPVGLPSLPLPGRVLGDTLGTINETLGQTAHDLLRLRTERLDRLVRRNRETIELDAQGAPARRGELLLVDPTPEVLVAAQGNGFVLTERQQLGSLGLTLVRVNVPRGVSLAQGEALLLRAAPGAEIAPDNLHFPSGDGALPVMASTAAAAAAPTIATPVGIIDGAPGAAVKVAAVRGFAVGAPHAAQHASAVASLLAGAGARDLRVADIYGSDPSGGNALALVRALDWLVAGGARVISISLTGPNNLAVGKAVAAAQRRGAVIVAAVGNDGPPPPPPNTCLL
jgi:hypothetical protein